MRILFLTAMLLACAMAHAQQRPWYDAMADEAGAGPREQALRAREHERAARKAEAKAHEAEALAADEAKAAAERPRTCAESFPERLADAKRALHEYIDAITAHERYEKSGTSQKIAWMLDHCRQLSPLEIAIRKLDDPDAFVCDPKAKGRPKGLTSALLFEEPEAEPSFVDLQHFRSENALCHDLDAADRFALSMTGDDTDREDVTTRLQVLCSGDKRPSCIKARAAVTLSKL